MQFKPINAMAVLFLVVVSLLVAGCTTSNTPTATPTATATSPQALAITAKPTTVPQQIGQSKPVSGNAFVGYNITITNNKAVTTKVTPRFNIFDSNGTLYGLYLLPVNNTSIKMLSETTLQPGQSVDGVMIFDLPKGHTWTKLLYSNSTESIEIPL